MANVYWDSNLFIYLLEDKGETTARTIEIRKGMLNGNDALYTSTLAVGEVLTGPERAGRSDISISYLSFFRGPAIYVLPFDMDAAVHYSRIRMDESISRADAMHLACAAAGEVDLFITNDDRLTKKRIPGIKFITSLSNAPF